jgi:NAD(P)-dependent dehydrogenase (short-subunit alcohol dehydrogenase family)
MTEVTQDLKGRVAIVTGANSGIGRAIAQDFAAAGAIVAIAGRNREGIRRVADEIAAVGGKGVAFDYNAPEEEEADRLVGAVAAQLGEPVICVANAGGTVGGTAPLCDMTTEMWRATLTLNLDAPFYLYRAVARRLIAAGLGGSLIGISSVASVRAVPSLHYSAAKGGLNAMTINLSAQLGKHGIRVNAILPGPVETPSFQAGMTQEAREVMLRRVPLKRVGAPEEIAGLARFLASDASSYVTGQLIVADGGMIQT